jgi:two-component system cell cycle response regulator
MSTRILVVDDNPLNLKLLAAKLAHEYYIVTTAGDGVEALDKIEREKPDLVLLDVMMPNMDGFETCKRIKADPNLTHIPVVMVTALSDVADRVKGLEAGADDFLTKPINDIALMARVRSLLRLKMIMDEWRLRESMISQFAAAVSEELPVKDDGKDRVLLLEDNPADQKFIIDKLKGLDVSVVAAGAISQVIPLAQEGNFSAIIASLNLKEEDGLQICPQIRSMEATRLLPILLVANDGEITQVAKGLDLGANDYLMRPLDANELIARVRTQLKQKRHYDRLRQNYEKGLSLALVDPLTGAFNRRYLDARLPKAIQRTHKDSKPLSILMLDIDHFKQVNDKYGHDAGDTVLKEVVNLVTNNLRPFDLVTRMGGEEFVIIMPEADISVAFSVGERLRQRVAELPVKVEGQPAPITVTISIGCAEVRHDGHETEVTVLKRADEALFEAKRAGRNRVISEKGAKLKHA